eukprot:m.22664 g.22664  ORF g.22664 m.22664 type:complete len:56 (+) comp28377_c0_seq8:471-638(+)
MGWSFCLFYAQCMREDSGLILRLLRDGEEEKNLRCCRLNDGSNACGMVSQQQCDQ